MPLPLIAAGVAGVLVETLPSIASWIFGDKTGKAVEQVTSIARDVLGTDNPADIERAIAADPAKALEFKVAVLAAEADARAHEREMDRQERETVKALLLDVQSARNAQVELAKTGSALSWSAAVVSVLAVASFAGILVSIFVFKGAIPPDLKDVFLLLIGAAISGYNQVLNYYLGSSSGSAQKTATLEKAATANVR